ncbi:MAG: thermonuclease family protein [Bdellovibrionales bacterium]|nr:thermonuclease family protein [Bdellovibrionales bacterium]
MIVYRSSLLLFLAIALLCGYARVAGAESLVSSQKEGTNCSHDETTFRCVKFIKNYDGDTATFDIPGIHPLFGKRISVRIAGIDTAEVRGKGPCEKDSARTSRRLVENKLKLAKSIELRKVDRDKYFRILAEVYVDGQSLAEILIANRLAVPYDGGKKSVVNWCEMGRPRVPASK